MERREKLTHLLGILQENATSSRIKKIFNSINDEQSRRIMSGLKGEGSQFSLNQAMINKEKNRYCDIIPYDYNRIVLQGDASTTQSSECNTMSSCNYINASLIKAPFTQKLFVATQGPIERTVPDFWHMVWQENSNIILMLTKEVEKGRVKCHPYWEIHDTNSTTFSISETLKIEMAYGSEIFRKELGLVERELILTNLYTNERRKVIQLHFLGWPDHGVPDSANIIFKLCEKMESFNQELPINGMSGPPIIHCSAGCGRTGTFIFIDTMLWFMSQTNMEIQDAFLSKDNDLVVQVVKILREQRISMVQSEEQLQFCYDATILAIKEVLRTTY